MELTGEYTIPGSREKVWQALNDPEVLAACIPGCEELEKVSDTEFTAKVKIKIGPVSVKFPGAVTLEDLDPPKGYSIVGEGKGGVAGFAKGGAKVALDDEAVETVLRYTADSQVSKLAQIGSRLIAGTARKIADTFFNALVETIAPGSTQTADNDASNDQAA